MIADSRPDHRYGAARDPAALVRDLDGDVLAALDDHDLDGRERILVAHPEALDDSSERVLQQLKADVGAGSLVVGPHIGL